MVNFDTGEIDFRAVAADVARALLGEPNKALSTPKELRWGSRGSLSLDVAAGVWHDHEAGEGGGVLDLIRRERGLTNGAAVDWMRAQGFAADREPQPGKRIVARYPYRDERGALLFEVCRFEPKDFRQRRPDGRGGWTWKLGDCRRVLYRLPELTAADPSAVVFVCEGEKAADALAERGLVATCSPQGAGKWRDAYAASLAGRRVVILPDADEPGERHAEAVLASLRKAGVRAAVLRLDGLAPKGDPFDWLAAGGDPADLLRRAEAALAAPEGEPTRERTSTFYRASALYGRPVPFREWLCDGLIPGRTVTMLGGDGGTGKSLLALQLAVAVVTGGQWVGRDVREGRALFISAEDDDAELHRRLADVLAAEGLDFAAAGELTLRSLAGEDALLATLDRKANVLTPTPLLAELDARLGEERPAVVILDTLADLHAGEENNRAHARQFIGMLRGLAIKHALAVVLLAHPSLTGMSSGSGLSGSTAWNASVRSRLYLDRVKDDGGFEPNPDARLLRTVKANYGRTGGEIALTWRAGVFVADPAETGLDRMAASAKAQRVFLKLLRRLTDEGRHVSPSPSNSYAPSVFARHPDAEGCTKRALEAAMNALFTAGKIAVAEHGRGTSTRKHIALTEGNDHAPA